MGKPDGLVDLKYSLMSVAVELSKLLNKNVLFVHDCVGREVEEAVSKAETGSVILLENLRFHIEEEGERIDKQINGINIIKASSEAREHFCKSLSRFSDVYVNDAFGSSHLAHR
jgi:phosphoglycerate kinase